MYKAWQCTTPISHDKGAGQLVGGVWAPMGQPGTGRRCKSAVQMPAQLPSRSSPACTSITSATRTTVLATTYELDCRAIARRLKFSNRSAVKPFASDALQCFAQESCGCRFVVLLIASVWLARLYSSRGRGTGGQLLLSHLRRLTPTPVPRQTRVYSRATHTEASINTKHKPTSATIHSTLLYSKHIAIDR